MRIGADGSWLQWPHGGLGRYLDGLLHAMASALAPDEELVVYYNSRSGRRFFDDPVRERFARLPNRTLWNQLRLPRALRADACDVFLAGAMVAPVLWREPIVTVVHDCLSFRDPAAKPGAEGRYWRRWTADAAQRASAIVAVSRFVADDCARFLGVDRSMVTVAHPGVDARFRPLACEERAATRAELARRFGLVDDYVLHVGSHDPHKDAGVAAEAVRRVRATGRRVSLVRSGQRVDGRDDALGPAVVSVGHVDDRTLVALYACARAVCVTSTHEGFGLPVVEAMACGTPVVATRAGGLPEAGGDVAEYVGPGEPGELATVLERLLDDPPDVAAQRREAGFRHARHFTWAATAAGVLAPLRAAGRS